MPTQRQNEAIEIYRHLMEEVKARLLTVEMMLTGKTGLPEAAVREFSFLQLRFVCELIALGCVAVHGDIRETTPLEGEYAADKIITKMQKLHADFFPVASRMESNGRHHHLTPIEGGLSKADLVDLYRQSGDTLHRGSLRRLVSDKAPIPKTLAEIDEIARALVKLTNIHQIALLGGNARVICSMASGDQKIVQVVFAEARN